MRIYVKFGAMLVIIMLATDCYIKSRKQHGILAIGTIRTPHRAAHQPHPDKICQLTGVDTPLKHIDRRTA